jgi:hypothetical protein
MKMLVATLCLGLMAVPSGLAKGRVNIAIGDRTPRVGQAFTVEVRTGWVVPRGDWLRLITVAPGKDWYRVVRTVTGDASRTHARVRIDGFEIKMKRVAPERWRALVRLPRPGRWRIVLPNGTHLGFMVPVPTAWMPWVQVSA